MLGMRGDRRRRTVEGVGSGTVQQAAAKGSKPWARVFAVVYDPFLWMGERVSLGALRQDLLGRACGRTVELGSGTGLNLRYYPSDLDELILTEPGAAMRGRLARRLRRNRRRVRVLDATAERLPFTNETVDTVVSTLVLCTVDAPDQALREVGRVLRPGGRLLFLEHVRSRSPRLALWQDRLAGPWRRFAEGCHCNRATDELIRACGLELEYAVEASWRGMPPIVRPLIVGVATKRDDREGVAGR
ncbi:class I SAM-dependent methyltransferase [Streptomyces shenzhenensis]|uniref:class I SAM-dependent methyltransferase n=1 Tax=Streptomyces shenzhenensis TaxID=943815 RepID=UPI0037F3DEDC